VQARDEEEHVAISHTAMVPHLLSPVRVEQLTAMSGLVAVHHWSSMAARMSATDSCSGVTEVSTTTSARDGGS